MKKDFKLLSSFLFFWAFLLLFKFGAGLHYTLLSPLGDRLMPLWLVGLLISGVINFFEDLGWTLGPFIAGILYVLIGPQLTIALGAIPLLALLLLYELSVRKHLVHLSILEAPRRPHKHRHKS